MALGDVRKRIGIISRAKGWDPDHLMGGAHPPSTLENPSGLGMPDTVEGHRELSMPDLPEDPNNGQKAGRGPSRNAEPGL